MTGPGTLSSRLVEQVRDRLLAGEVLPGLPIRQDLLASQLGVSKIPLREALAKLEQDGLVDSHPNRGYFVRPMTRAEAEEVFALRLKLEPDLIALAAESADETDQAAAADALKRLDRAMDSRDGAVGPLNRAFHLALLRPARQQVTAAILERLHVLSERYVRKHLEPHGRNARAQDEHRNLLDLWRARDGAAAAALLREHIGQTLADLRDQLTQMERPEPMQQ